MKKTILLIALVVAPAIGFSQSVFDKLENMKDVSSVVVNKDAFEMLSKFKINGGANDEGVQIFKMIQNISEFKSFSTDNPVVAKQMETMVNDRIKSRKLIQLMRVKDKDSSVKIYVDASKNKDIVNEVIMFINGLSNQTHGRSDSVIISLTGKIDMNQLSKLADMYSDKNKK